MKFIFVIGGSYKAFYINKLKAIKRADIVIFNKGIFYDLNYSQGKFNNKVVIEEIKHLNKFLQCPIVVCCDVVNKLGHKYKAFILCINQKISIIPSYKDVYLRIKGKLVLITSKLYKTSYTFATICVGDYSIDTNKNYTILKNMCFILKNKEVVQIKGGKIYIKFQKCCKFILKKNK